ncbi:YcaO-like family protein [Nocardiopsis alba]|uniref:YcaO-like family protein n=2 Tax=Nocardiopsis alba TaxID=53437 RepID=A0ABV5DZ35_9ACTN|nr:YcaO-like family protein [Nocardiopsis alba]AFR07145.1 bacteriocin biosynthesis docking scaffold, SagD family domain protein [Nocardiopsis alba ATCC BAA-2165]
MTDLFVDALLRQLTADGGLSRVREVSHGPLTDPTSHRPKGAPLSLETCVGVLHWRGRVHLLKYDLSGTGGCPYCLAGFTTWQQVSGFVPEEHDVTEGDRAAGQGGDPFWELLSSSLRALVLRLAGALMDEEHPPGTLLVLDTVTCATQRRTVPPRTACPRCDTEETTTRVRFDSPPETLVKAEGELRGPRKPAPSLATDYVGPQSLFREPLIDVDSPAANAQLTIPLLNGERELTAGRSRSFGRSRVTAILEGLERYAGFHHRASSGKIRASLRRLGDLAIDPRDLGHHSKEQYDLEGFPFAPLGDEEEVDWVEVSPPGADAPCRYLPENVLYWARRGTRYKSFFADTSNGFALGQTPEEAALHAALEVVERDAFMLTWYRRLLLPEIVLGRQDRDLADLVDRIEVFTGFRVRLFWAAVDTGIPVVIALAARDADSGPCRFLSAGASLFPAAAAESALVELAGLVAAMCVDFEDRTERAHAMSLDFDQVRGLDDHSLVAALPSSRGWFDFLTRADRPIVRMAELLKENPGHATVRADLDYVAERIGGAGASVYFADVTTRELRWRDLVCVRAITPGLLPITFGHPFRRMEGLPRLYADALPHRSLLQPGESPRDVPPHPFA